VTKIGALPKIRTLSFQVELSSLFIRLPGASVLAERNRASTEDENEWDGSREFAGDTRVVTRWKLKLDTVGVVAMRWGVNFSVLPTVGGFTNGSRTTRQHRGNSSGTSSVELKPSIRMNLSKKRSSRNLKNGLSWITEDVRWGDQGRFEKSSFSHLLCGSAVRPARFPRRQVGSQ
jgi:hypothetical protein